MKQNMDQDTKAKLHTLSKEMKQHLKSVIIPFWKNLRDDRYGGFYGYMNYDLKIDKEADKGCILNSRILWFFSNAYLLLKEESLMKEAVHAYRFMQEKCMDHKNGGIYWAMTFDGKPLETIKHTYNQAFAIYALASYYDASCDQEALKTAMDLFELIEGKCRDEMGYLEAFDEKFNEIDNEKLSENGVIAEKTMNTLLHVFEAYTELYRVSKEEKVRICLEEMLNTFSEKVFNPKLRRQEVFFDQKLNSILDLHSYGHDIETAWLIDRGLEVLGTQGEHGRIGEITAILTDEIYKVAFDGHSLANEAEKGVVNEDRIWWVQAETVVGFLNGFLKNTNDVKYLTAASDTWEFIKEYLWDKRKKSEWFWKVTKEGVAASEKPIVEPWKCPYHNGRMCFEVIRRIENVT